PSIIDDIVDLGPDKFVNFIVTATVSDKAIGTISPNIAVINGEDKVTPPIPPKVPTAPALTKKILVGADKLDKSEYTAGGTIVYEVVVTNPNEKLWLNDVNVLDSISSITATNLAGNTVTAFKPNWIIAMTNLKPETIFTVGGYPKTNVNLNETMDLAPGDTVTFKITALVNDNIVGKIVNSTSGTYKKSRTETPTLGPVTVESETKLGLAKITKTPFQEFYSPNGSIGFNITIENTSEDYLIDNLKLTDIISAIKALKIADGTETAAFKTGWTITYQVVGDAANTNATAIPATGDINAVNLDIGKLTKINIQIRGIAADGIYGDITNSASYDYPDENPVKEVTATVKPKDPIVTLVKSVNVPEYGPTDTILYTLELSNTGTGAAIGVTLEDKIGTLTTDLTGTPSTGLAFTAWERELTSVPVTSTITAETTTGDTYKATLNIAPGDKVIITLKGTLNPNAYGKILNVADATYRNGKNEILPLTDDAETVGKAANLFLRKEIDKNIYQDEDTLVFKVLLQNPGFGWGNNIPVRDSISTITDDIVGPAFASWTIDIVKSKAISSVSTNPESANPPTPANTDLNVLVDIAPQSQVAFIITAKLKPNVSSKITNIAYMTKNPGDPETPSNIVTADPIEGNISILKSVEETKYTPGEKLTYIIEVRNNANILAKNVIIKDALNSIKVSTNKGILVAPFSSWKIVSITPSSTVLPVTLPSSIVPAVGTEGTTDIEVKTNIKANETISIKVEGIVSLGNEADGVPTGTLENKATATYNEKEIFDTVTNTPGDPIIVVNKVIKTLAGKPFEGQKYNSGDELVYEISVENSGAGMASDVSIKDAITTMTTELAGGLTGPAFSTWTIAIVKTKATTLIEPATVGKDNDINLTADIDRGDKVVITITATINPKAVGIIPKNVVTVGETEKETPKVDPEKGVIQFIKEIVKGKEYTQGGTIEYKLTITNPNKTFVNDVSFIDEISKIKATGVTEDQVTAFKSWTVKRTDNGTGSTYTQEAEITVDINDKIDISPNDVIVYTVTGVVNENVVGDIVNTGYVEYVGPEGVEKLERSVTSENVPGTVTIEKDPISPNYLPNGEIGFTVVVTNTSTTSVANNITVKDSISSILAEKIGGGTVPAFQTGWTITAVLEGSEADKAVSNITALEGIEPGKDINAIIDLGKNTKVIITVKGIAANNIYGDIINTASFDYPEAKDEAGKTGKDEAVIKNTPSTPTLVKVVDKATYLSGETLEYTITIKNPGESIIAGFKLTDEIGKVTGEISGENVTTGPAFVSWSRLSLTIPDTSSLISETVKNSIEGDTYNATLDLAPGDEVVIKLTAVTKTNVFGELKNTAVGKYNEVGENGPEEKTLTSDAISTGKVGKLGLTKTVKTKTFLEPVSSYLYSPGEEVEYTITVSNNGEGWVRNAKLEDIFTDIKTKLYPTGELGAAMQSGTLSVSHVSSESENSVTIVENNPNLVANIDIKNGSTITFTAKIKVSNDAVSFLTNIAVLTIGEGENKETIEAKATIFAQLPKVSLVKTVDIQEFNLS
ncbi:MAG: hypothetical protein ACRCYM_02880, partial [Cetobacterium sp.]